LVQNQTTFLQALLGGAISFLPEEGAASRPSPARDPTAIEPAPAREALKFMFSPQGAVFRCALFHPHSVEKSPLR